MSESKNLFEYSYAKNITPFDIIALGKVTYIPLYNPENPLSRYSSMNTVQNDSAIPMV